MSASDQYKTDVLRWTFQATASMSADTVMVVSLHTGDPGDSGNQSTSETTYGSYARISTNRSSVSWSVSGNVNFNIGTITFPAGTSGAETVTHFGIGRSTTAAAAGTLHFSGALTSGLAVGSNITPSFGADQLRVSAA
jgi:hypothetical protein